MALSESGGGYAAVMIYGPKGKRITVLPKKGPAPSGRVRSGKKTVSYYVRPRGKR
jgi:hypothetical protein